MLSEKKITKKMQYDRAIIIAAVSCSALDVVKEHYADWLDNNGYYPFYEMIIEIVDELMFTKGSEYLKFANAKDQTDWFIDKHDTCFDWYFMEEGRKLIHRNLK